MTWALLLVICVLQHALKDGQGLQWRKDLQDGVDLTHCAGENVTFPWGYTLEGGDDVVGVTWSRHNDQGETVLGNLFLEQFKAEIAGITQVGKTGILVSNITKDDTGTYRISVRLNGVSNVANQTARLIVAEKPETSQGLLEVVETESVSDTTESQTSSNRQRLLCGKFTDLGTPPVSVVWEDPNGRLLPSSHFEDGYFALDLPEVHSGGNYFCLLNLSSTAVGCLSDSSNLRDKSMVMVLERVLPASADSNTQSKAAGLSGGAVAGIVIAVLIIIVIAVVAVIFVLKYKRGKSYSPKEPDSPGPDQEAAEPFKVI